jgi:hypothetical protein
MIQANELRIGNIVNTEHGIGEVASIYRNAPLEFKIGVVIPPLKRYEYRNPIVAGIELTDELLLAYGFETPEYYEDSVKYKDGVLIDFHMGEYTLRDNRLITLKYLHQLQNLYFALTNKELEVKESDTTGLHQGTETLLPKSEPL